MNVYEITCHGAGIGYEKYFVAPDIEEAVKAARLAGLRVAIIADKGPAHIVKPVFVQTDLGDVKD